MNTDTVSMNSSLPIRVISFFVYLNTLKKTDGGQTGFPKLNLSITPKIGTAIVWSNVRPRQDPKDLKRYEPDYTLWITFTHKGFTETWNEYLGFE